MGTSGLLPVARGHAHARNKPWDRPSSELQPQDSREVVWALVSWHCSAQVYPCLRGETVPPAPPQAPRTGGERRPPASQQGGRRKARAGSTSSCWHAASCVCWASMHPGRGCRRGTASAGGQCQRERALGEKKPLCWALCCWDRAWPDACRNRGDQRLHFKEGACSGPGKDELMWLQSWDAPKWDTATAHRYGCRCETAERHLAWQCNYHGQLWGSFLAAFSYSANNVVVCSCISVKTLQSHKLLYKSVTNFFSDWNTSQPSEWLSQRSKPGGGEREDERPPPPARQSERGVQAASSDGS